MAEGILAAVNENGNIDRFIDTKGGVHYIEPKRYEESVAKIDAAATKAKETVNSATEAVSECKAQTGACTQETARAKEIADTVESRITGIEGDIDTLRDSVSRAKVLSGSKVITFSAERHPLFEVDEQQRLFGRALDATRDYVGVMNGDGSVSEFVPHVHITNGRAILVLDRAMYQAVRINYVVVLGS